MQTKILVLRKNRLLLGLFLLVAAALLVFMLSRINAKADSPSPKSNSGSNSSNSSIPTNASGDRASVEDFYKTEATYRAGVYTCGISLNDTVLSLEIVLDKDHINSIRLINLEDSVATMYPLMEPAQIGRAHV